MHRAAVALAMVVLASGCVGAAQVAQGPSLPHALLAAAPRELVIEVGAVAGRLPDPSALALLRTTLGNVTGKDVVVVGPILVPAQGGDYTEASLRSIHDRTGFFAGRSGFIDSNRVVLHVLYLDGRMRGDDDSHRTLGRSLLDLGLIVLFRDTYAGAYRQGNTTRTPAAAEMDRYALLHEAGHALGLVGNGIPMVHDHADAAHPGHSRYPESVMYYHPPMTPAGLVTGRVSDRFDVDDLADLAAYRSAHGGLPPAVASP